MVGIQSDAIAIFSKSLHLAPFHTGPAALAAFRLKLGAEGAGNDLRRAGMTLESSQNTAAATTTTADSNDIP